MQGLTINSHKPPSGGFFMSKIGEQTMAIISGILQDGLGNPINGSLTLRARRTTSNVIEDTEVKFITENGQYFLNLRPCEYDVFFAADGYSKKQLGIITVYQDSPNGTLNEYVITPSGGELTPEILKQVLEARDEAKKSAEEARESSSGASVLNELSSSDGSARIGHYGSNVQTVMDNNGLLHYWIAQMAAGKRVNIVCYGDSTTDGQGTTGWVKNVAGTDHNLNAPNAWSARTQSILRSMFNNNEIFVHNAGFAGKRLDNGWAVDNYKKCVIDNKFYGVPDIILIGFGINDAGRNTGDLLGDTLRNTNLLLDIIAKNGTLPILLTSSVHRATSSDSGGNRLQLLEQLNELKRRIAQARNIPLLDLDIAIKNWMSTNPDGYRYQDLQSDFTHWGDLGHSFQACWVASIFYKRILKIDTTTTYISTNFLDSRSNSDVGHKNSSASSSAKYGITAFIASLDKFNYKNNTLLDIWVWCEHIDASIIYRRNLHDANDSIIKITDMLTGSNYTQIAGVSGRKADDYSGVDMPFHVGQLKYGLNRIQLIGDGNQSSSLLFGHFDFVANYQGKMRCKNLLQKTGTFRDYQKVKAPEDRSVKKISLTFSPDVYDPYGENVVQLFNRDKITNICLEGKFTAKTGIFLVQSNGSKTGEIVGLMLYGFSGTLSIFKLRYNTATREINYEQQGESAEVKSDDDGVYRVMLKSYFNKNGSPVIDIYHADKLAKSISWDGVEHIPPLAGVVGNIYRFQSANKSSNMLVEISKFEVFYTDK